MCSWEKEQRYLENLMAKCLENDYMPPADYENDEEESEEDIMLKMTLLKFQCRKQHSKEKTIQPYGLNIKYPDVDELGNITYYNIILV
ncbi:hypothetical protein FQR65_LT00344 [Abscondita terminalis]|nr:hypothetical protein FQR65_LT00344 [Abscondita terminalis]